MGWNTRRGAWPDEKRNQLAQQRHDRNVMRQSGEAKAERINEKPNERRLEAKRQGR